MIAWGAADDDGGRLRAGFELTAYAFILSRVSEVSCIPYHAIPILFHLGDKALHDGMVVLPHALHDQLQLLDPNSVFISHRSGVNERRCSLDMT